MWAAAVRRVGAQGHADGPSGVYPRAPDMEVASQSGKKGRRWIGDRRIVPRVRGGLQGRKRDVFRNQRFRD